MRSRVPLVTSNKYIASEIRKSTRRTNPQDSENDFGLFDEQNLLDLNTKIIDRERYVKAKLSGRKSKYDYHNDVRSERSSEDFRNFSSKNYSRPSAYKNDYRESSRAKGSASVHKTDKNLEAQKRIQLLKEQIEQTKKERLKVIAEGEREAKKYMEILLREQAEYSRQTESMRREDEQMNSNFLKEISDLDRKLSTTQEPIEEIKRRVKERIKETRNSDVSISSMRVSRKE